MAHFAYDLRPYQIRPPFTEDNTLFQVDAKVPPGATQEEVKVMLRNLLTERFKLAFHRENAEVKGYALVVAKSGFKMKESAPPSVGTPATARSMVKDADGFSYFLVRNGLSVSTVNGLTRWVGLNIPVDAGANEVRLTGLLSSITGDPVIDSTGLKGKYDLMLTFSSDSSSEELTVFQAVEKQLGLKMEPRKISIDTFAIDHAEKTPVEN